MTSSNRLLKAVAVMLALGVAASCAGPSPATTNETKPSQSTSKGISAGRPFPTTSGSTLDAATSSSMQREIERWVSTGLIMGVTAAVVSHGKVWSGAAGVDRTGMALTAETGLTIGSVTKTFVAAEILQLVEGGRVGLDSPASAYIDSPLGRERRDDP